VPHSSVNSRLMEYAAAAVDRAYDESRRDFDTLTPGELARRAGLVSKRFPMAAQHTAIGEQESFHPHAPDPASSNEVVALRARVELLEEKLAILFDILKMNKEK
jgi:hypothetical protein